MLKAVKRDKKAYMQFTPRNFHNVLNLDIKDGEEVVGEMELTVIDVFMLMNNEGVEDLNETILNQNIAMNLFIDDYLGADYGASLIPHTISKYDKIFFIQNYQIFDKYRGRGYSSQGLVALGKYLIANYLKVNPNILITTCIEPHHFKNNDKKDKKFMVDFYDRNGYTIKEYGVTIVASREMKKGA